MASLAEIDAEIARREKLQAIDAEIASREVAQFDPQAALSGIEAGNTGLSPPDLVPMAEATLANITGAAAGTVAPIGGGIQAVLNPNNPMAGPDARDRIAEMMTYQPRTEGGQRIVQGQAELLAPIAETIEKGRLGDEALEAGFHPGIARIAESLPEYGMAGLAALGLRAKPNPLETRLSPKTGRIEPTLGKKEAIKSKIINNPADAATAEYALKAGKVVSDPIGKAAVKQGFSEPIVAMVKAASPKERFAYKKMVNIVKRKLANAAETKRPSDIAGDSLMERISHVQKVNKQSEGLLNRVAIELRGKPVDVSAPLNKFRQEIADLGGVVNKKGKLVFDVNSQVYKQPAIERGLRIALEKADALGPNPDAFKMHQFKKALDSLVSYGKTSQSGLAGSKAEWIIKNMRHDVNASLKGLSRRYDKVNTAYSDTRGVLEEFQGVAGKKMDLTGARADSATGTLLRRLLGNAQSRITLETAADNMESIARKYGGKFDDNLTTQMKMTHELERIFGPSTETSFKAEIGQGIQRGVEDMSMRQPAQSLARGAYEKAFGISQERAFEAIDALLNSPPNR